MGNRIFFRMNRAAWKKDKFGTVIFSCFIAITVMLFSLSVLMFSNLTGAIDHLMEIAKTPDFLQMHAGAIDVSELEQFAEERNDIEKWQIFKFLNLENSQLSIGEESLQDSTQDNGICVQGDGFDLLLTLDDQIPEVKDGTVWVPVCYQEKYNVEVGKTFQIGKEKLIVAGFIRDSQMNSMMASSKRFLVSEKDYKRFRECGTEEYIIEYLLKPQADIGAFQNAYENADLPGNGPTVTRPLMRMMNALSDGIMILILMLISLLVLFISLVCIRFMLFTNMENEKKEVGLLKAIGISRRQIRFMFSGRYALLTGIGAVTGFVASLFVLPLLSGQMKKLYGAGGNEWQMFLFSAIGAVMLSLLILLYLFHLLKKLNEMTAIRALAVNCDEKGKSVGMRCIFVVAAITVFLMIIPANLYRTMSSEQFVTYMGIGNSQLRMDIRQTEHILEKQEEIKGRIANDNRVKQYGFFKTSQVPAKFLNGETSNILVEQGEHTTFPVSYSKGSAPVRAGEIAISYLLAEEWKLHVGDKIKLKPGNIYEEYVVCGIYSDITNGGKTAKVVKFSQGSQPPVMWSLFYLTLEPESSVDEWVQDYQMEGVEIANISEYVQDMYGQTISQIQKVSILVKLVATIIMLLVITMFLRLLISKERNQISIKKALGFGMASIKKTYLIRAAVYFVPGIIVGSILGNVLGEKLCSMVLRTLGADGFRFVSNPLENIIIIPALAFVTGIVAMLAGIRETNKVKPIECMYGKE